MQINASPLSNKLAGGNLRDADTFCVQLARRQRRRAACRFSCHVFSA